MAEIESILQYIEERLDVSTHPDFNTALNGLQVGGPGTVEHVCAAVDASERTIRASADRNADLLLVHHGLFWPGLKPITGRLRRKVAGLLESGTALYSVHLPLDGHPDIGNCILLARALDIDIEGRLGEYEGADLGWWGRVSEMEREAFREVVSAAVGGPVHLIPGGPDTVETVGVVTGGGGRFIQDAADLGLDAYVTGEGNHPTYVDAMELGVNVYYAGHYATETFGVKALAAELAERFDLTWDFVDDPSGL